MIPRPNTPVPSSSSGLEPVSGAHPAILILGSFPSVKSLRYTEYYGNPQNQFWKIMETLFAIEAGLPYELRIEQIRKKHIALWDVVRSCSRPGSADARISEPVFNDIAGFVATHPTLQLVALNGSTAARFYSRIAADNGIPFVTLPSTSPANTRLSLEEKIECWSVIKKSAVER